MAKANQQAHDEEFFFPSQKEGADLWRAYSLTDTVPSSLPGSQHEESRLSLHRQGRARGFGTSEDAVRKMSSPTQLATPRGQKRRSQSPCPGGPTKVVRVKTEGFNDHGALPRPAVTTEQSAPSPTSPWVAADIEDDKPLGSRMTPRRSVVDLTRPVVDDSAPVNPIAPRARPPRPDRSVKQKADLRNGADPASGVTTITSRHVGEPRQASWFLEARLTALEDLLFQDGRAHRSRLAEKFGLHGYAESQLGVADVREHQDRSAGAGDHFATAQVEGSQLDEGGDRDAPAAAGVDGEETDDEETDDEL